MLYSFSDVVWVVSNVWKTISGVQYPFLIGNNIPSLNVLKTIYLSAFFAASVCVSSCGARNGLTICFGPVWCGMHKRYVI